MNALPTRAPILPHGGSGADFLLEHYPNAPQPWLDLSAGINPWPYPHDQISAAALNGLPSPSLTNACRSAAAAYFGAEGSRLALLSGSQAAISLLPRLFSARDVDVLAPGYSEHARNWHAAGHTVTPVGAPQASTAPVLVLTNPNNPDGRTWKKEELARLGAARTAAGHWLVIDEAFGDVMPQDSVADLTGNLMVLRSFGKFFGLAGLRLGFVIAPPDLVRRLEDAIGPWPVNGPALEIGARAYADHRWHAQTRTRLSEAAARLRAALDKHGLADAGGTDLFRLVEHKQATALFEQLCQAGIYVRRFANHPRWLRFGLPANDAAFARLEKSLQAWAGQP